jgi:hypothetical protein
MSVIQITKVEPLKEIEYVRPQTEATPFEVCKTPFVMAARQNLYVVMRRLIPRACDECFLDKKEWKENALIHWVRIFHGEGNQYGFSIRMSLQREDAKAVPIVMPALTPELTDLDCQMALKALVEEAKHYLAGQRETAEQVEMFVKDDVIVGDVTTTSLYQKGQQLLEDMDALLDDDDPDEAVSAIAQATARRTRTRGGKGDADSN